MCADPQLPMLQSIIKLALRPSTLCVATTATAGLLLSPGAYAFDARAIALGGSTVANGLGVNGVIDNPASLLVAKREGTRAQFLFGGALDGRDHSDLLDVFLDEDNQDLPDDLASAIDDLSNAVVSADCTGDNFLTAADSTICLNNTALVAELSNEAVVILDEISDELVEAVGQGQLGFAVTGTAIPFAFHFTARASISGIGTIDDEDREFASTINDILQDDILTLGEIRDNINFNIQGASVSIDEPEDVLVSTGDGTAMTRAQFGFSVGASFELGGTAVDIGITPKFSQLTAFGIEAELSDAFDEAAESFQSQFDDSEARETSFTFDLGASAQLSRVPLRVSAVLRNIVPESINTATGFEFETTPQLLAGVVHHGKRLNFMGSIAFNPADLDGIETQPVALGVEFKTGAFALRGGISTDLGRIDDEVALSAGVKLGPLEIGGRLTGINEGQFGAQLAFGF